MLRCELCKKKSIINFKCKCKKNHCIKHQLPEHHNCEHKEELFTIEIQMPLSKITYI
jgi:predicted nucleic acid binding AN1-type Zn finger protein